MDNLFIEEKKIKEYGNAHIMIHEINDNIKDDSKIISVNCSSKINLKDLIQKTLNSDITNFTYDDYIKSSFKDKYDLIIFYNSLFSFDNLINVLLKTENLLNTKGRIIFNIPSKNNFREIFASDYLLHRYSIDEINEILSLVELYPVMVQKEKYLMSFESYLTFKEYLKNIGFYQKIVGDLDIEWTNEFDLEIESRFKKYKYLNAEYLVYTCGKSKERVR